MCVNLLQTACRMDEVIMLVDNSFEQRPWGDRSTKKSTVIDQNNIYIRVVEEEEEIGTTLCAGRWCCLSSLLGYWAQSWMGRHSDTVYQHAGTHFADLGRMTGRVNPT